MVAAERETCGNSAYTAVKLPPPGFTETRMTINTPLRLLPLLALLTLTGCKMQTGSHQLDTSRSFTLQRTTQFFWSRKVERWLTVSRMPDCQRKHRLDDDTRGNFSEVRLRRLDEQRFQVQDGKTLLLADLERCTLQELPRETAKEGELLGKFAETTSGSIPFEATEKATPAAGQ